ncbi:MAG: beta-ketoacyl-[acyl-carrier-protein] synthase family protein [Planctomycetia bacterium]|nr:beta-ketoacyl-[acyl-carrier-protein] synthase family protein [Planctomycetia bacterium]
MVAHHEASRAAAITGVGVVSPLGASFAAVADELLAGRSGVREIAAAAGARAGRQFAAPVVEVPVPAWPGCADFAELGRLEQLCLAPSAAALVDAGPAAVSAGTRLGIVLGIGAEHLKAWELDFLAGGRRVFEPRRDDTLVHRLARRLGIAGPAVTVAAACASSGYALALGRAWLEAGQVDACLVGGCDILSPTAIAAFHNLRALSRRCDDPARASRPFDRDRDGFVMGEGGAFFLLEHRAAAARRGARVYGELVGVGMSSDAHHMVAPCGDPREAARAISTALADAGIEPAGVDYVNAHAAGTPVGDAAEAGAIRLAFGAAADAIPVSSTKSMSGHLVSGAAAFEAVACLAAIHRNTVPPTINLDAVDPACALDHVPHVARRRRVDVAVSNSFGFGGANLCLVIRRAA